MSDGICGRRASGAARVARLVLGFALVAGPALGGPAAGPVEPPAAPVEAGALVAIEALSLAVTAWTAAAMDRPMPPSLAQVRFRDPPTLAAMRYGEAAASVAAVAATVVAVYDDAGATIYLPEGWTGATPAEVSVLVHETVHHLQNVGDRVYECPAAREAEAYAIQDRWLAQFGLELESEFDLNPLALVLLTRCGLH